MHIYPTAFMQTVQYVWKCLSLPKGTLDRPSSLGLEPATLYLSERLEQYSINKNIINNEDYYCSNIFLCFYKQHIHDIFVDIDVHITVTVTHLYWLLLDENKMMN